MVREREGESGRERERDTKGSRASAQNGGVPPSGHVQDDQRPRLHRRENKEYRVQSRKAEKRTLIS